jgi:hypothetical protein
MRIDNTKVKVDKAEGGTTASKALRIMWLSNAPWAH